MKEVVSFIITKKENGDISGGQVIRDHLKNLVPGKYTVQFEKAKNKRSQEQNKYYWKIVINDVRDGLINNGFDASLLSRENVHEYLKGRFLKVDIGNNDGEFITITRSTAGLTTVEFKDYVAEIQKWAAEFLGCYVRDPGEQADIFNQ